jgi:monoamine oxidase
MERWVLLCCHAPGVLAQHGPALRTPAGRIHWAGTETAAVWYGSMEGAIESGERAAAEICARIDARNGSKP